MRPNTEYTAIGVIHANGVRAYNAGDDVPASAVENLGLVVGRDVLPANVHVIPRPAGNAKRAEWEAYWLGQGLSQDEVDGMNVKEMADRKPEFELEQPDGVQLVENPLPDVVAEQATEQTNMLEPPASNALKPEWVKYAIARGMPENVARESTVAQLQDFDYDHLP